MTDNKNPPLRAAQRISFSHLGCDCAECANDKAEKAADVEKPNFSHLGCECSDCANAKAAVSRKTAVTM